MYSMLNRITICYNFRHLQEFQAERKRTMFYDLETISYRTPHLWTLLSEEFKKRNTIRLFKSNVRQRIWNLCPCRLHKLFVPKPRVSLRHSAPNLVQNFHHIYFLYISSCRKIHAQLEIYWCLVCGTLSWLTVEISEWTIYASFCYLYCWSRVVSIISFTININYYYYYYYYCYYYYYYYYYYYHLLITIIIYSVIYWFIYLYLLYYLFIYFAVLTCIRYNLLSPLATFYYRFTTVYFAYFRICKMKYVNFTKEYMLFIYCSFETRSGFWWSPNSSTHS